MSQAGVDLFHPARLDWMNQFKHRFSQEIESITDDKSVIISSEHFHSRLETREEIERLFALLKKRFSEIKVLVYLRRQIQVAVSLYSTLCRTGGYRESIFPKNITEDNHYYNYYLLLEKWSNVFGQENLVPRIFE